MGQPVLVQINGAVTVNPVVGSSLIDALRLFTQVSYGAAKSARLNIQAPVTPFSVPLEGVAAVRVLAMKFGGQSMRVRISTPNGGALQAVPTSDVLLLHNPNSGDEITAIDVLGTGDLQYLIAGDST